MAKRFPIRPSHPERNCWGCDRFCAANDLICGNGSERTQHPVELFGDDWVEWAPHTADPPATPGPEPAPDSGSGGPGRTG